MGLATSIATTAFSYALTKLFVVVFTIVEFLTVGAVKIFNYLVFVRIDNGLPVLKTTWTILRDFSNMLFIVALIWIAFSIVFNRDKNVGETIGRLVIVAILINFSLVLGGIVIDGCQVLTNVMLNMIGDPAARIGQYLNPSVFVQYFQTANGSATNLDLAGGMGVSLIFFLILSLMFLFSIVVADIFALIRIFYIWGLLAISPIVWMAYILPGKLQSRFKDWWGAFLGWNLFLPFYLFMLYLGLLFLSQSQSVMASVMGSAGSADPLVNGLDRSLTFNLIFFYTFAAVIIGYGASWARAATSGIAFGTQQFANAGLKRAQDWTRKIPGVSDYFAAQNAAQKRVGDIQGYFKQRQVEQQSRYDRRFRVGGTAKTQKTFVDEVRKEYDLIEDKYDTGTLDFNTLKSRALSSNPSTAEGYAYRRLALKKGALEDSQYHDTLAALRDNPYAIQDLVKTAKDAKFAGIKNLKKIALSDDLQGTGLTPAKREMLAYIAGDAKMAGGINAEELEKVMVILGGPKSPEATAFLKDFEKVRPDLAYEIRKKNGLLEPAEDATGPRASIATPYGMFRNALNTEPKNIASMPDGVWGDENTPDIQNATTPEQKNQAAFQAALRDKLNDRNVSLKTRRNLKNRLETILLEQGADKKLKVLKKVAQNIGSGEQDGEEEEEEPANNPNPTPGNPPGTGTTISYREPLTVNENNVIDLRKVSRDKIDEA